MSWPPSHSVKFLSVGFPDQGHQHTAHDGKRTIQKEGTRPVLTSRSVWGCLPGRRSSVQGGPRDGGRTIGAPDVDRSAGPRADGQRALAVRALALRVPEVRTHSLCIHAHLRTRA